jgi:hypothetical protein
MLKFKIQLKIKKKSMESFKSMFAENSEKYRN